MNSAKLIQVIVTESPRGIGTDRNPFRNVTEYWTTDGTKLAEADPVSRDGFVTLLRQNAEVLVETCDEHLVKIATLETISRDDADNLRSIVATVRDLIAKTDVS